MLKVKNYFDRPDIENIDAVLIRKLNTFVVSQFKNLKTYTIYALVELNF